jgi:hypothetical protein
LPVEPPAVPGINTEDQIDLMELKIALMIDVGLPGK